MRRCIVHSGLCLIHSPMRFAFAASKRRTPQRRPSPRPPTGPPVGASPSLEEEEKKLPPGRAPLIGAVSRGWHRDHGCFKGMWCWVWPRNSYMLRYILHTSWGISV